ncbi:MAG: TonB-dependent receptor, partial [Saprospiraceae bacterium]|nr:TonB-dependent receptor [Saprospiraceae bacterium]
MKNLLLAVFMTALSLCAYGQASLEISLINETNEPVIGQVVMVTNAGINYEKQAISDENGKIQIGGLSTSGTYNVAVLEGGFYQPQSLQGISLISDKTKSVTFELKEKVLSLDAVTVSASSFQTINTVDAEVASELTAKEITELPIEGRDITRALYRLPNITQATGFYPEAPNVAINGANSLYTNYQIDGMDNNENFLGGQRFAIPSGFTKNITALTNNFSAEHGLTSNGIINITTKSGTNETTGEAFYITRPGPAIDASSAYAQRDLSGNQVKDGFQRHQAGFGIGGALKQNRTFYYLNFEHTTDIKDNLLNVPQLGINETVRGINNFTYLSTKIDQHWSQKFRSSLRANVGVVNIERQGGGLDGGVTFNSAGNQQDRNSVNIAFKNTYLGENFTYEGNYLYGRFRWNYANPIDHNSP